MDAGENVDMDCFVASAECCCFVDEADVAVDSNSLVVVVGGSDGVSVGILCICPCVLYGGCWCVSIGTLASTGLVMVG